MPRGLKATTVIKKGGEYVLKKKKHNLKRPPRALYTEEEKKERSRLRAQNRYYRKRITALTKAADATVTMKDLRKRLSPDLAYVLMQFGYLNEPNYSTKDIRDWMIEEGDLDLLDDVLDEVNSVTADPNAHIHADRSYIDDVTKSKIDEYSSKIKANEERIDDIAKGAKDRKHEEQLKYLDKKEQLKEGDKLLNLISQGKIAYDKLSEPEKAAIRYAKNTIVEAIFNNIDFDKIPEDYRPIIKRTIYATVMEDPVQGLRDALRGNVALLAAKKYGTDAGFFAAGLTDTMTSLIVGKPNATPALKSAFAYMISKTPMNKGLMQEVSEDLINSGQSTNDAENGKMLARDVVVDIAKDLITTGGNVFAALPMIVKDVIIDTGQAGIRKMKYDKKELKDKAELDKIKKSAEEAQKKFKESGEQVDFSKIEEMFGVDLTEERAQQIYNTKL